QARPTGASSGLGALASQFGIDVGSGARPAASPQFYSALISTNGILREAAESENSYDRDGNGTTGAAVPSSGIIGVDDERHGDKLRKTINELQEMVSATVDQTGRIHVRTRARSPDLAVALNERILAAVVRYNREVRQSNTAAERKF